ncbi:zinc-dependent dehydrogenase [Microbacterium sp. CFH 31415]|uniref:zinc-dependent dehydrogenase n=1 Tax=Microbacterium sp. CFH 31415 TaxID=2921732 RepID=UPI001F146FB8|nr:zinc-dependent dehydrogenase [Microbacterium sp. CFH 31415]MCH6230586.1 zinc-dependent dehydrogenase [Microbacterium sp. CFH 31415]
MRAAVFHEPGRIEVTDVPVPALEPGDVLMRVRAASICGTDLRIMKHGHFKIPAGTPRVLGHEVAGEIAEVGDGVSDYRVGDRVSITPNVGCGHCEMCVQGLNQLCPTYDAFGITLDGGFEEYMRVPSWAIARGNLVPLPDAVPFDKAALMEPAACCLHGQRKIDVGPGDDVLIIGAGPIGCLHTLIAKRRGARRVIVANRRQSRLDIAATMGADVLVNVTDTALHEEIMRLTEGRGVDVVITCVSNPDVIASATDLLARLGRLNVFSGLGDAARPAIDVNALHYRELVMTGTTGASNKDYRDVLDLLGRDDVDLSPIISQRFSVEDIQAAFDHAASGAGMKPLISFEGA